MKKIVIEKTHAIKILEFFKDIKIKDSLSLNVVQIENLNNKMKLIFFFKDVYSEMIFDNNIIEEDNDDIENINSLINTTKERNKEIKSDNVKIILDFKLFQNYLKTLIELNESRLIIFIHNNYLLLKIYSNNEENVSLKCFEEVTYNVNLELKDALMLL